VIVFIDGERYEVLKEEDKKKIEEMIRNPTRAKLIKSGRPNKPLCVGKIGKSDS